MFNLDESKKNYEDFKNIIEILKQKTFDDLQNNIRYYTDIINDKNSTSEDIEFCNQMMKDYEKQYEKNKRKIKEFYSQFVDILLNN